jgi:MFS family permease
MVQLLMAEYSKEEEKVLLISNVSGVCIGVPAAVLISYLFGFFSDWTLAAATSYGWTAFLLEIAAIIVPACWIVITVICFFLFKKHKKEFSIDFKRMMLGTLILPVFLAYDFLIIGLIVFPFCIFLLQYFSYLWVFYIGSLALIPFLIFGGALFLPESRAGKALRRSLRRSERATRKHSDETSSQS